MWQVFEFLRFVNPEENKNECMIRILKIQFIVDIHK